MEAQLQVSFLVATLHIYLYVHGNLVKLSVASYVSAQLWIMPPPPHKNALPLKPSVLPTPTPEKKSPFSPLRGLVQLINCPWISLQVSSLQTQYYISQ